MKAFAAVILLCLLAPAMLAADAALAANRGLLLAQRDYYRDGRGDHYRQQGQDRCRRVRVCRPIKVRTSHCFQKEVCQTRRVCQDVWENGRRVTRCFPRTVCQTRQVCQPSYRTVERCYTRVICP